jgi:serine/threonine protein kinase
MLVLHILSTISFSFVVNMQFAFQDQDNLYLVFTYLSGGNLRYHLSQAKTFSEEQASKFIYLIFIIQI